MRYSTSYKKDLDEVNLEIQICEDILSGKRIPQKTISDKEVSELLRSLRRHRASIMDNPQYGEGLFESYIIR